MIDTKHCRGCTDNFYNVPGNGDPEIGCWGRDSAEIIRRRRVGIDERPPWTRDPEMLPSCYKQKGSVFVNPEVQR